MNRIKLCLESNCVFRVELKLAKILIDQNTIPFKFVLSENNEGLALTNACKYWTKSADDYALLEVLNVEL